MKVYHYTVGIKIPLIMADGFIRASPKEPAHPEKPVAWLSSNGDYELTALKIGMNIKGESKLFTRKENEEVGQGLCRFTFDLNDISALPWSILKTKSRMPAKIRKSLEVRAKTIGAKPSQWFGVLGQLGVQGVPLEIYVSGEWLPYTNELAAGFNEGRNTPIMATVDESGALVTNETWER